MILEQPHYQIIKKISTGQNRTGDVFLIRIGRREYVLKSFDVDDAISLDSEIKIGMMLNHPNLNRVEGHWYDPYDNTTKVIFVYEENVGTLDDFILNANDSDFIGKVEIALGLSSALNYLHSQEIFHRDIKTKNIILTVAGTPVLIDYDMSCIFNEKYVRAQRTRGDVMCRDEFAGTISYMHPRYIQTQINGTYIDMYSLGIVFLCLFAGFQEPPYPNPRNGEDTREFFLYQKRGNRDFFIDTKERYIYQGGRSISPPDSRIFRYPYLCTLINRMINHSTSLSAKGLEGAIGLFVEGYESVRC